MPRPPERRAQAMDPMTAYQMIHILEGVVKRGTAVRLRSMDRPLFGKTGTTSGPTNAWFVGGSPDLIAGLSIGYAQPQNLGGHIQGRDRDHVVEGRSVYVRVQYGGSRNRKKKRLD